MDKYHRWLSEEERIKAKHRSHRRVAKTVAMRDKHRSGELSTKEYKNYLNSGRCGTII